MIVSFPSRLYGYRVAVTCMFLFAVGLVISGCSKKKAPQAKFRYQKKNCTPFTACSVAFTNESIYADSYKWDFGDGTTSTETNPEHTFPQNKDSFIVKLKAISLSEATDHTTQQVVYITEAPACENIGSFKCAGKLESGIAARARIDAQHNPNYYYFVTAKPGVAKIQLSPVPSGSSFKVSILSEARDNSPVLRSDYGYAGETITLYAGPLAKDSFFVKIDPPYNAGSELYTLTYTFNSDDPNEINDKFSQATFLPFAESKQGTILAQGDLDYFRFYQSKAGTVDITLSPVPLFSNNNYLYMDVFSEANSSTKIASQYGKPGETIKLTLGPLDTGSHYILLRSNYESPDKYNLLIKADDSDPNELNNTFSKATPVQNNVGIKATIKAEGDEDYYKYVATANGLATITIDKVPGELDYLYVEVFKDANTSARIDSKYAAKGNALTFNSPQSFVAGQIYYFRVFSYYTQMSNEQYTFKVKQ